MFQLFPSRNKDRTVFPTTIRIQRPFSVSRSSIFKMHRDKRRLDVFSFRRNEPHQKSTVDIRLIRKFFFLERTIIARFCERTYGEVRLDAVKLDIIPLK